MKEEHTKVISMEENMIRGDYCQKLLPLKKRSYALAFAEDKPDSETETSPPTKLPCSQIKHEVHQTVKTEEEEIKTLPLNAADISSTTPTVKPDIEFAQPVNPENPIEEKDPCVALFDHIEKSIKGDEVITEKFLVMDKTLTKTDMDKGQARLSIPLGSIKNKSFLTEQEKSELERIRDNNGERTKIVVKVIGSNSLKEHELDFTQWNYDQSGWRYVLIGGWRYVMKDNEFERGQKIQLWSYRRNSNLCFAIVGLGKGKDEEQCLIGKSRRTNKKKRHHKKQRLNGKSNLNKKTMKKRPFQLDLSLTWKTRPRSLRIPVKQAVRG